MCGPQPGRLRDSAPCAAASADPAKPPQLRDECSSTLADESWDSIGASAAWKPADALDLLVRKNLTEQFDAEDPTNIPMAGSGEMLRRR